MLHNTGYDIAVFVLSHDKKKNTEDLLVFARNETDKCFIIEAIPYEDRHNDAIIEALPDGKSYDVTVKNNLPVIEGLQTDYYSVMTQIIEGKTDYSIKCLLELNAITHEVYNSMLLFGVFNQLTTIQQEYLKKAIPNEKMIEFCEFVLINYSGQLKKMRKDNALIAKILKLDTSNKKAIEESKIQNEEIDYGQWVLDNFKDVCKHFGLSFSDPTKKNIQTLSVVVMKHEDYMYHDGSMDKFIYNIMNNK